MITSYFKKINYQLIILFILFPIFFSFSNLNKTGLDYLSEKNLEQDVFYYNNGSISLTETFHYNGNKLHKTVQDKFRRDGTRKYRITRNPNYITFIARYDKKNKLIKELHFYYDSYNRLIEKIKYKNGEKHHTFYTYDEEDEEEEEQSSCF